MATRKTDAAQQAGNAAAQAAAQMSKGAGAATDAAAAMANQTSESMRAATAAMTRNAEQFAQGARDLGQTMLDAAGNPFAAFGKWMEQMSGQGQAMAQAMQTNPMAQALQNNPMMQALQNNPMVQAMQNNPVSDAMQGNPVVAAMMQAQRQGMDVWVQANRTAWETMQAIARKQNESWAQSVQLVQEAAGAGMADPSRQADLVRQACQKSLNDMRELAEMASKSQATVLADVTRRANEQLKEMQKLLKGTPADGTTGRAS